MGLLRLQLFKCIAQSVLVGFVPRGIKMVLLCELNAV